MRKLILGVYIMGVMFQSIVVEAADTFRLVLPGESWAVELNLAGFEISDHGIYPGFSGLRMQANNHLNGLVMSAYIEPAKTKLTTKEVRDHYFEKMKKSDLKKTDLKQYEKDDKAFTEYIIKDIAEKALASRPGEGIPEEFKGVNQKNIWTYMALDNSWVDVHLSKIDFKEQDQALFDEFIGKIKVVENYVPNSHENFIFGNYFYIQADYENAIKYFQKSLDQEKKISELPEPLWQVLVDNLGMAFGISGDLEDSKRVFEYGISMKPKYPMFHYNIGCTYAEMGDLDKAIKSLKTAFKFKDNMIKGEFLPDPSRDSSFAKFLNDERFVSFLKVIER